eukprot:NP_001129937.2 Nuclear Hormone Receptor family [Caenorhabditis elegans]
MIKTGDCVVCESSTHLFKHGKYLCNSCDLFFRRSMEPWSFFGDCKHSWDCYKVSGTRKKFPKCRHCRFNKCVDVGLLTVSRYTKFADLIKYLFCLDANREHTFLNFSISSDFDTNNFLDEKPTRFIKKTHDLTFDCHGWAIMNKLSAIEKLRSLDFPKYLSSKDLKYFFKGAYFLEAMLTMAMRCYFCKEDLMHFPHGVDLFPVSVQEAGKIKLNFLNLIRCQLVGKFIELKITREEIIMISAIAFSNPVPDLSFTGQNLLSCYQKLYTSSLLQYCLTKYQQNGPARFCNLVAVLNVATQTYENILKYLSLYQYFHPDKQPCKFYQSFQRQLD